MLRRFYPPLSVCWASLRHYYALGTRARPWRRNGWKDIGDEVAKEIAKNQAEMQNRVRSNLVIKIATISASPTLQGEVRYANERKILVSNNFIDIRRAMFQEASAQLGLAEMDPTGRYHKEGAAIVSKLLQEKGSISKNAYYSLIGREVGVNLLEGNVFAFRFNSGEVTFRSTMVKRFCEQATWQR